MTLRVFIAIELPSPIRQEILKQTMRLRQNLDDHFVHWVPTENMHLTLKFLGDIPPNHLDFIKQSVVQVANSSTAFDLQIGGIGSFPNSKMPCVLWIGLQLPAPLTGLYQAVEAAMVKLGYKKEERSFSPHLTIGRIKQTATPAEIVKLRDALQNFQLGKIGTARVNSVHVFKSDLNPAGSEYTKLFSVNFKQ